jgi:hypothetical protein
MENGRMKELGQRRNKTLNKLFLEEAGYEYHDVRDHSKFDILISIL